MCETQISPREREKHGFQSMFFQNQFPPSVACPISHDLMQDPVKAPDGKTYERKNIERWLQINKSSLFTREEFNETDLVEDTQIKEIVQELGKMPEEKPYVIDKKTILLNIKELNMMINKGCFGSVNSNKKSYMGIIISLKNVDNNVEVMTSVPYCNIDSSSSFIQKKFKFFLEKNEDHIILFPTPYNTLIGSFIHKIQKINKI